MEKHSVAVRDCNLSRIISGIPGLKYAMHGVRESPKRVIIRTISKARPSNTMKLRP